MPEPKNRMLCIRVLFNYLQETNPHLILLFTIKYLISPGKFTQHFYFQVLSFFQVFPLACVYLKVQCTYHGSLEATLKKKQDPSLTLDMCIYRRYKEIK